ncbi:MAG: methylcobalamin:coenzyme M methyltransferase [Syntrophorhabdus sp. PtaU1.Bin058]|nr:MAG: methylcobalamin:coenzyme M methyltransferase [Syntrophorhabdus sp. PtaU1.Bin058]
MISHRERVLGALRRAGTDALPKGELFLPVDLLDRYCPERKGEYIKQLASIARLFGLSLLGADLGEERLHPLLAEKRFGKLDQFFTVGCIKGPVSHMIGHLGFYEAMMSIRKAPRRLAESAAPLMKDIKKRCLLARDNGFCAVAITDDIAANSGLLFSHTDFVDIALPLYRQIAQAVKSAGLLLFFHSDGNIRGIIRLLIEAGYDCIHPVDAQAGMDLYEMKADFGKEVSFMGHIDIAAWDPKRISAEITRAEGEFRNGGLILGSSCGIASDVSDDALAALYPDIKSPGRRGRRPV